MCSGVTLWTSWGGQGQGKGETAKGRIAGGIDSYMDRSVAVSVYGSAEKYEVPPSALRNSVEVSNHCRSTMKRGGTPHGDETEETDPYVVL